MAAHRHMTRCTQFWCKCGAACAVDGGWNGLKIIPTRLGMSTSFCLNRSGPMSSCTDCREAMPEPAKTLTTMHGRMPISSGYLTTTLKLW